MGKVSETQAIIALWWVSVEPSGGMQLAMKGNMLCDTSLGSVRVGEVQDELGVGFRVVTIQSTRYELSVLQC